MKNKKGSHVGFILSFVIFVTFIIFMYSILSPTLKDNSAKEDAMKILKQNLIKEMSSNLTTITLDNSGVPEDKNCVIIDLGGVDDLKSEAEFSDGLKSKFVVDKTDGNKITDYKLVEDSLEVSQNAFKIYFSRSLPDAIPETWNGENCAETVYRSKKTFEVFGTPNKNVVGIEKTIEDMNNPQAYAILKDEMGIDKKFNFGVKFIYAEDTYTVSDSFENPKVVVNTDIYSEETLINYIDQDANMVYGKLQIKLW